MLRSIRLTLVLTLAASLAAVFACTPSDPAARVAKLRDQYTVKLNSWIDRTPAPEPPLEAAAEDAPAIAGEAVAAAAAGEMDEEAMGEGEMDEEEMDAGASGPGTTILFDLVVLREGDDSLPGLTLDVTHADQNEEVKEVRRHWLDTSKMHRGGTMQVEFELEGLDFEDGDRFAVEVRPHVPPEERHLYREFAAAGN